MTHSSKVKAVIQFPNGEVYPWEAHWQRSVEAGRAVKVSGKEAPALLQAYRQGSLLALLKPGSVVYTVCVKQGSSAHYQVLIPATSTEGLVYIRDITAMVANLVGHRVSDKTGGIVMGGWGYSKGFQIVYGLGLALWPNGTPEPHGTRNGEPDSNGGYALKQQAL